MNRLYAGALASLTLLAPSTALASPSYSGLIAEESAARCAPACTVCHDTASGGYDSVVKPFGRALQHEGLVGEDEASLRVALRYLTEDSDGDGIDDLTALARGRDPNDGTELCALEYGCGATIEDSRPAPAIPWFGAALLMGSVLVLRRKVTRRSHVPHGDGETPTPPLP